MGYYSILLKNESLFLFSLKNNNQTFINLSLEYSAFDKDTFKKPKVVKMILELMDNGSKTNLILNVLLLIDIGVWSFDDTLDLILSLEELTGGDDLENKLMLSNNPLMSIALSSELLSNIGDAKETYKE